MKVKLWQIALIVCLGIGYVGVQKGLTGTTSITNASVMNGDISDIEDQFQREAAADFTRPWAERRGIESIDRNAEVILVKAPLDELSNALAAKAVESRRDVVETEIEISGAYVFAYQIAGQDWSIMVPGYFVANRDSSSIMQPREIAQLSKQLKQPVIESFRSYDGEIGYNLFEDGELIEHFKGAETEDDLTSDFSKYRIQPRRYVLPLHPESQLFARADLLVRDVRTPAPFKQANFAGNSGNGEAPVARRFDIVDERSVSEILSRLSPEDAEKLRPQLERYLQERESEAQSLREQESEAQFEEEEEEEDEQEQVAYFWSRRRQVTAAEIADIYSFANQFLVDYDAYDPDIDCSYLLGDSYLALGKRYQVLNLGRTLVLNHNRNRELQEITAVPDLVRVDYFRFED